MIRNGPQWGYRTAGIREMIDREFVQNMKSYFLEMKKDGIKKWCYDRKKTRLEGLIVATLVLCEMTIKQLDEA